MTTHDAYLPVGYKYKGQSYCLSCIPDVTAGSTGRRGEECNCAEHQLARIAAVREIDRMNEWSYDEADFPKQISCFNDIHAGCDTECSARCANCGESISRCVWPAPAT